MTHDKIVETFSRLMLAQMTLNDSRNHGGGEYIPGRDINTFDTGTLAAMLEELKENVRRLESAIMGEPENQFECTDDQVLATNERAADVANMAMLLAFECGALRRRRHE